jgi:hypothetical protein
MTFVRQEELLRKRYELLVSIPAWSQAVAATQLGIANQTRDDHAISDCQITNNVENCLLLRTHRVGRADQLGSMTALGSHPVWVTFAVASPRA